MTGRDGAQAAEWQKKGAGVSTAELLHSTRVVRAFNCIPAASLANNGNRQPERIAIPVGGDDAAALEIGQRLVREAGFDPVVVGSLAKTREFDLGQPLATGEPHGRAAARQAQSITGVAGGVPALVAVALVDDGHVVLDRVVARDEHRVFFRHRFAIDDRRAAPARARAVPSPFGRYDRCSIVASRSVCGSDCAAV